MNTARPVDTVDFHKMHGCGNHFVLIDNRELEVPIQAMAHWARKVCAPGFGVGADGLIFLQSAPSGAGVDYLWHFYNADGSRAEMCGNASRCAARLAMELGLAGTTQILGTDAGPVEAEVLQGDQVRIRLTPPTGLELGLSLDVAGQTLTTHFVNTGVPHAVTVWDDVSQVDVATLGRAMRFHPHFAPAGSNANFIQIADKEHILLRTYERGVEAETHACGTGAAASAVVAHTLGLTNATVDVITSGQEILRITLENGSVFLQGAAVKVYAGILSLSALGLSQTPWDVNA